MKAGMIAGILAIKRGAQIGARPVRVQGGQLLWRNGILFRADISQPPVRIQAQEMMGAEKTVQPRAKAGFGNSEMAAAQRGKTGKQRIALQKHIFAFRHARCRVVINIIKAFGKWLTLALAQRGIFQQHGA